MLHKQHFEVFFEVLMLWDFWQNRQSFTQLLGETKAPTAKTAVVVRTTGRGRGKGEARVSSKDNKLEASTVKERASSTSEIFSAFGIRFVRLNGLLFTRTRYFFY